MIGLRSARSGRCQVAAPERVPLGLGHHDRIVLVVAGCDHDEVLAGEIDMTLQVVVAVPVNLRRTLGTEHGGEIALGPLVSLIVVESTRAWPSCVVKSKR